VDITGRKRAEAALREREHTLQGIFRAAPVGIGMVSHRVITQANDQLCRMTGYTRDELLGQDARMFYLDDEAYDYVGREKYERIVDDGVGAVETQWRTKGGTVLDILLSSSPIDLARPHEDVVFNALDVTRLRESERALESYMDDLQRSNEELQRFAYVASHDLQEPLRSIVSFSQLLERRYRGKLDQDADEYIAFIVDGGNRMQRLIQDLLTLSRIETLAGEPVPVDAGRAVMDALVAFNGQVRELGGTVTVGPLPTVRTDPRQLEQVFANLVGNAIKYRREGVPLEIRIAAKRTNGMVEFSVADNGIGIEEQYYDRIFEMFRRLHTHDKYSGTWIGLAVVKRIVERCGGTIRVESRPGEGSTFFFTLPAA
jgi:PAS domain S-box-containing protein